MGKHTPGPWSVKNDYDERHIVIANIDGESFPDGTTSYSYEFVCDTYGGDYESESRDVANANARLIAAAPDMLEALRIAKTAIRAWHGPNAWDIYNRASPEMKAINAAIAKAEGRS